MLSLNDYIVVPVHQDLDVRYVSEMRRVLKKELEGSARFVILDFDAVDYIDSSGLALILAMARNLWRAQGRLSIINVNEVVLHVLELSGLLEFLPYTKKAQRAPALAKPQQEGRVLLDCSVSAHNLGEVRTSLAAELSKLPLSPDAIQDSVLAAGEAMGNFILHTAQECGRLVVEAFEDRVIIEALDTGAGFEIAQDAEPATTLEHGRGIKLMRLLVDGVDIEKREPMGTTTTLTKFFD